MKISVFSWFNKIMIHPNDDLHVFLFKTLSFPFVLAGALLVILIRGFFLIRHWVLVMKNKDGHKVKGFVVTQRGNMIHTEYDDRCSCGRREAPKDVGSFLRKFLE